MTSGCVYTHPHPVCWCHWHQVIVSFEVLYSYRRGLRSCLSKRDGKFDGQECEISDRYGSHAFFCIYVAPNRFSTSLLQEVARTKAKIIKEVVPDTDEGMKI